MTATADSVELVAAVTDPTRRKLLDLLLEHGDLTPSALAGDLPITRQAVSKHLVFLNRVGLVSGTRTGREVHYRLNVDRLDQAASSLGELAHTWDRRLMRIKRLAEDSHAAAKQSR